MGILTNIPSRRTPILGRDEGDSTDGEIIVFEIHQYDFKYVIVSLSREKGKKNILQKLLETENGKFNKREIGRYSKIASFQRST